MKVWARVGIEMNIAVSDIQDEQKVIEAIKAGTISGEVYFPEESSDNDELYKSLRALGNCKECSLDVLDVESLSQKSQIQFELAKRILEAFELREQACKNEDWDEENTQMLEIKDLAVDLANTICSKCEGVENE